MRSTEGLIRALASYAICLARTVADRDGVTEAEVWGMLIEKFKTTVIATAEIHRMTKAPNSKEGNSNDV
ncbi:hypothetical protein D2E57_13515 [Mycobacteroides abscessus]|nr:hypothetical protein D2E57_13515 [Mycobacteroides abscessus]